MKSLLLGMTIGGINAVLFFIASHFFFPNRLEALVVTVIAMQVYTIGLQNMWRHKK